MNARLLILIIAIPLIGLSAQAQNFPAIVFNNTLSSMLDTIQTLNAKWGKQLKRAVEDDNFFSLKPLHTDLSAYLEKSMTTVRNMKNYRNSAPLKEAMLEYLKTMKMVTDRYYTPIEEYTDEQEDVDIDQVLLQLKKEPSIQAAEENLLRAQRQYAEEHGQTIGR